MPKYLAEGRYTSDGVKGLAHEAVRVAAPTSQKRLKVLEENWKQSTSRSAMLTFS